MHVAAMARRQPLGSPGRGYLTAHCSHGIGWTPLCTEVLNHLAQPACKPHLQVKTKHFVPCCPTGRPSSNTWPRRLLLFCSPAILWVALKPMSPSVFHPHTEAQTLFTEALFAAPNRIALAKPLLPFSVSFIHTTHCLPIGLKEIWQLLSDLCPPLFPHPKQLNQLFSFPINERYHSTSLMHKQSKQMHACLGATWLPPWGSDSNSSLCTGALSFLSKLFHIYHKARHHPPSTPKWQGAEDYISPKLTYLVPVLLPMGKTGPVRAAIHT